MSRFDRNPELIFQFRLAMDLGMTVGQLRKTVSVWELLLWSEFYRRERSEIKKMQEKAKRRK
jgi:hypothetical protein